MKKQALILQTRGTFPLWREEQLQTIKCKLCEVNDRAQCGTVQHAAKTVRQVSQVFSGDD